MRNSDIQRSVNSIAAGLGIEVHYYNVDTGEHISPEVRPLWAIVGDIRRNWPNPYFGAVPYLEAMANLSSVDDDYGFDSGRDIVRYFLANATSWRGEDARRIKAELKGLVK